MTSPPASPPASTDRDKNYASYAQLAELYSVGRTTAARAYSLLHDRGIVIGAPGRGVFVVEKLTDPNPRD